MRIIKLILVALMATLAFGGAVYAAENPTVHAILITATNEKAPADPRLAPYEAPLQRNLPESSFRYVAEGSASVSGNGRANIALGNGHRIELEAEKGGALRLKIQWMAGNAVQMSGIFNLQPGIPIVLGRRPSGEGNFPIVVVVAK